MDRNNCGTKEVCVGMGSRPSFLDTLQRRRKELADSLAETDSAIAALQADPKITQVLEALRKVSGLL